MLKLGMKDDEILQEIKMRGVSGETSVQMTEFLAHKSFGIRKEGIIQYVGVKFGMRKPRTIYIAHGYTSPERQEMVTVISSKEQLQNYAKRPQYSYEIALNDKENNYWLIKKTQSVSSESAEGDDQMIYIHHKYYLAGFNDDSQYFITQVQRMPSSIYEKAIVSNSVMPIVDWMNKKDMGFKRLQGDILYKRVDYRTQEVETSNLIVGPYCPINPDNIYKLSESVELVFDPYSIRTPASPTEEFGRHHIVTYGWSSFEPGHILMPNKISHSQKQVQDHYDEASDQYRLVTGASTVLLKHSEHKDVSVLTGSQALLLTHQRGKEIESPMLD